MKKYFFVFLIFSIVGFYSCGVPEDEHNKVLSENKKLKLQVADLQNRIDISTLKANLSLLSKQLNEYQSGIPNDIITSLDLILTERNTPKLEMVLGNSIGEFIASGKTIQNEYEIFQSTVSHRYDSLALIESKIKKTEDEIDQLKRKGIEYKSFYIKRRFDTDSKTGKGMYECADFGRYKKVVLLAYENEVESNSFVTIKDLVVEYLGERPTIVTTTTIYNKSHETEYFKYYSTVEDAKNPIVKKKILDHLIDAHRNLELKLNKESKLYLDLLESTVLSNREIINKSLSASNM